MKISVSFRSADVFLFPNVLGGLVGVGLRRTWVRSTSACVSESLEDSLGKVSVVRRKFVVSETLYFAVLGM